MNQRELILVGGGGHCKSVIEVAESAGRRIAGILDVSANVGKKVLGYDIIGTDDSIAEWAGKAEFVVTVGHMFPNMPLSVKGLLSCTMPW